MSRGRAWFLLLAGALLFGLPGCAGPREPRTFSTMLTVAPAAQRLFVGDGEGSVQLLEADTDEVRLRWDAGAGPISSLRTDPSGERLAVIDGAGTALLWQPGSRNVRVIADDVTAVALSSRAFFVARSEDSPEGLTTEIRTIDWERDADVCALPYPNLGAYPTDGTRADLGALARTAVLDLDASPDGRYLAIGSEAGLYVVDLFTQEFLTSPSRNVIHARVPIVRWTPSGDRVLYYAENQSAGLLDPWTRRVSRYFWGFAPTDLVSAAISPDGERAVFGTGDGVLILVDLATGRRLDVLTGEPLDASSVAFAADTRTVVVARRGESAPLFRWRPEE